MLSKKLAVVFIPFFFAAAALAGNSDLQRALSHLHAASQAGVEISALADNNAKSDLVKAYASTVSSGNAELNAKLMRLAQSQGIKVLPLDPQTEAGKSLIDRLQAEVVMLRSLKGDAFDKAYMTLVTNTQQSVLQLADARIASATDPEVKTFFTDLKTHIENRLTTAQDILAKVYGSDI